MKSHTHICLQMLTFLFCFTVLFPSCGSSANLPTTEEKRKTVENEAQASESEKNVTDPDASVPDDHAEPERLEYEFHSIGAMQALWNATKQDDAAVKEVSERVGFELFGRGGPDTVEEAKSIFEGMGDLPFIVLDDNGGMDLTRVNYCHWGPERPDEVETVYQNRSTKNFFRIIVQSGLSYSDLVNDSFADETLLQTCICGGYEMRIYQNARQDLKEDVWNSVGVINADGAAILVYFNSENEEERGRQVSVEYLIAPLKQLTISTLFEQIGVK